MFTEQAQSIKDLLRDIRTRAYHTGHIRQYRVRVIAPLGSAPIVAQDLPILPTHHASQLIIRI